VAHQSKKIAEWRSPLGEPAMRMQDGHPLDLTGEHPLMQSNESTWTPRFTYRDYELVAWTDEDFIEAPCQNRCTWKVPHTHAQCLRCPHRQHLSLYEFSHYAAQLLIEHCRAHEALSHPVTDADALPAISILEAFRSRFSNSPDINEFTPFGFFATGWNARDAEDRPQKAVQSA